MSRSTSRRSETDAPLRRRRAGRRVSAALFVAVLLAASRLSFGLLAAPAGAPLYKPDPLPDALLKDFQKKNFKLDPASGNYLGPKVYARTKKEELVAVMIGGKYINDLRGHPIFIRKSINDRLMAADAAMFKDKKQHISVTYGFRSNALQQELFKKLSGVGKVAPPGQSFHETGMALDLANWRDAQKFMIEAGFVGGCYGIEEDLVHYSIDEITKASNMSAFKRCTLKEIPKNILKGIKQVGKIGNVFRGGDKDDKNKKKK